MLIAIPLRARTQKEAVKKLKKLKGKADLAEIWLDQIRDLDVKSLLAKKPIPLIAVYKMAAEKGSFKGAFKTLAERLITAGTHGAEYLDIPFRMPEKWVGKIIREVPKKCRIILSYHNYKRAPSMLSLTRKIESMRAHGADIVKIAVCAKTFKDTLNIILLARELQIKRVPHVIIAIGQKGRLSRILTPHLGGAIMYAPLKKSEATGDGQFTVSELKKAWKLIR